jgi:uncharacterized membrane protein YqaE (UPF0057 family)
MLIILAIIFPPLAVYFVGKPIQILYSILFSILGFIPGAIYAIVVVKENQNKLIKFK